MIVEIKHKTGSAGRCLGYDFGDMKKKDQVAGIISFGNLFLSPSTRRKIAEIPKTPEEKEAHKKAVHEIAKRIAKSFDNLSSKADSRVKNPLVEYIISFAEGEHLTAKKKQEIVHDYLDKMGILGPDLMFIATEHKGTNCEHIHVLCNRLNISTRKAYSVDWDHVRSNKICAELNEKFNLVTKVEKPKPDRSKTNAGYLSKIDTAAAVRKALGVAIDKYQFQEILEEKGIDVKVTKRGVVYVSKDADGITHHWSGAQLGKDLTLPSVNSLVGKNLDDVKSAFPFRHSHHMQYIVHGQMDASIFRAIDVDKDEKLYQVHTGVYNERGHEIIENYYEKARQALKERGLMVGSYGPSEFYRQLAIAQERGDYRVGDLFIEQDGKITFGQERIFGNPERTAYYAIPSEKEEIAPVHAPAPAPAKANIMKSAASAAQREPARPMSSPVKLPTYVVDFGFGDKIYVKFEHIQRAFAGKKSLEEVNKSLRGTGITLSKIGRKGDGVADLRFYIGRQQTVDLSTFGYAFALPVLRQYARITGEAIASARSQQPTVWNGHVPKSEREIAEELAKKPVVMGNTFIESYVEHVQIDCGPSHGLSF